MASGVIAPTVSAASTGLGQNGVIAAALLLGFVVYVTITGRLAAYVNLFFASKAKPSSTVAPAQSNSTGATPQTGAASTPGATSSSLVPVIDLYGNKTGFSDPAYLGVSNQSVDTSNFIGGGVTYDPYTGPSFIDGNSTF